jgi:hypothetical protein
LSSTKSVGLCIVSAPPPSCLPYTNSFSREPLRLYICSTGVTISS